MTQNIRIARILRTRSVLILISILVGAITGLLIFGITRVTGRNLFALTGGIAGAAAIFVYQLYARAARLTEVKLTIPQLSELTFVVNNDSRQVAWKLFIETVTRISTQPLMDDEGILRESLTSLYGLFGITRETLKLSRPSVPAVAGRTVEHLAISMLNNELRPFLSKWHPILRDYEHSHPDEGESNWPGREACRNELRALQQRMHNYACGFADLAGVSDADSMITGRPSVQGNP